MNDHKREFEATMRTAMLYREKGLEAECLQKLEQLYAKLAVSIENLSDQDGELEIIRIRFVNFVSQFCLTSQ